MRITRRWFRFFMIPAVILVLAIPLALFAYSHHAHAQTFTDTCNGFYAHCLKFDKNWTFDSTLYIPGDGPGNVVEVRYNLEGYIGYSFGTNQLGEYVYSDMHILDADMNATVFDCVNDLFLTCYTYPAIDSNLTTMNMTQEWTGYPICSTSGSLSFSPGPPWVSLNLSDSCSAQEVKQETTNDQCGHNVSGCSQDNTSHPVPLATWVAPLDNPTEAPCLGINIASDITEYYPSDNKNHTASFSSTSTREVCLPVPTI